MSNPDFYKCITVNMTYAYKMNKSIAIEILLNYFCSNLLW